MAAVGLRGAGKRGFREDLSKKRDREGRAWSGVEPRRTLPKKT